MLLSTNILPHILAWLDSSNRPLDHMYEYLMQRGLPVRVAYPNLIIMEVNKTSSVSTNRPRVEVLSRYKMMRWKRSLYQ